MEDPNSELPPGVVRLRPRTANENRTAASASAQRRFVYDVDFQDGRHVVRFEGKVLTSHADQASAIENAKLIASNFWSTGISAAVRLVEVDGALTEIVSFG